MYVKEHTLERVFLSDCDEAVHCYNPPVAAFLAMPSTSSDAIVSGVSMSDSLVQYQCIEKPQEFNATCTRPYCCRLKPKMTFRDICDDPNNQLAASWLFRQYLHGLHTEDITGKKDVPQLAMNVSFSDGNYCSDESMVCELPTKRTKVTLILEFRSSEVASFMGQRLKDGSRKLSDTQWETFIFVTDSKVFHECLLWKYADTNRKWNEADNMLDSLP